jgi:hypothetical protein
MRPRSRGRRVLSRNQAPVCYRAATRGAQSILKGVTGVQDARGRYEAPVVREASRTSFTVAGASQDRQKRKTGAGRFAYLPKSRPTVITHRREAATNDWTRKQMPIAPMTRLPNQNDRRRIRTEIAPTAIAIWNIVTLLANPSWVCRCF